MEYYIGGAVVLAAVAYVWYKAVSKQKKSDGGGPGSAGDKYDK
jgi:hypothetical protein